MTSHRILALAGAICLLACLAVLSPASAEAAVSASFPFGNATVHCLADAIQNRDMSVFPDADPAALKRYVPSGSAPSAILAFLIVQGKDITLIDAGFGRPTSTLLPAMKEAGVEPSTVTTVLLTHMHRDHVGGLTRDAQRVFPNATVRVAAEERRFWTDPATLAARPALKENIDMVAEMLAAYGSNVTTFAFGDTVGNGLTALDAVGHTPGHTAFLLSSGGRELLLVGDLLHAAALQFPRPDINASYDMDKDKAAAVRRKFLTMAAERGIPVLGDHFPFPGVGMVRKAGEGFVFEPGLPTK
jgi:glyoxylase-like metal-dependent hydrolase (beta-lactamase superfamily II)